MPPTCLITGGAGFIGSHLVEACIAKGYRTIVLDNLLTGKLENLPPDHPDLEFIEGDIRDRALLSRIRKNFPGIVYIYHLAAIASVAQSMKQPIPSHEVNYLGTLNLLEEFRNSKIKKFTLASSAAVYGDNLNLPLHEGDFSLPLSLYGIDKLSGEYLLRVFNDAFGVPTLACRFFNVFGERQNPLSEYSGVISIFFDRAISQKKGKKSVFTIHGDGRQTRDFIYVADVVSALIFLAEAINLRGEIFNVGYGGQVSILQLAERIKDLLHINPEIHFGPNRNGDIRHSQAAIQKLINTGFAFRYNFDSGLQKLAEWVMARPIQAQINKLD
jgi:UDP-glucose 4-epimerase